MVVVLAYLACTFVAMNFTYHHIIDALEKNEIENCIPSLTLHAAAYMIACTGITTLLMIVMMLVHAFISFCMDVSVDTLLCVMAMARILKIE